jgi:3-deoxy-7-phosphoheptulonate synthase
MRDYSFAEAVIMSNSHAFKLADLENSPQRTVIKIGEAEIGSDEMMIIAGPCAVESREQVMAIAERLSQCGVKLLRGGAYKPRTSPYSFQGLGEMGLMLMAEAREKYGLRIVTEAVDTKSLALVADYADVIQIGSRNMQNFSLLRLAGRTGKPILLKRGMAATLEEFLSSAEYILAEGNLNVILCERGIRTFAQYSRFTLDVAAIPALKQLTHLPILIDPSHSSGITDKVIPLARAGIAAGADGVIVEVHHQPQLALSDGAQALTPELFQQMVEEIKPIFAIVRRHRQT